MNLSSRGTKHACPECATKYYDLNKDVVTCPKCGAKPAPAKLVRGTRRVMKPSRPTPAKRFP
jgi:uncharacterized protein (TIGR02300 family)